MSAFTKAERDAIYSALEIIAKEQDPNLLKKKIDLYARVKDMNPSELTSLQYVELALHEDNHSLLVMGEVF